MQIVIGFILLFKKKSTKMDSWDYFFNSAE